MKTTVIYHSADFDGIFCREIARIFFPEAKFIGWDHGNPKIPFPTDGTVYVLDLSPDCFEQTKHVPGEGVVLAWIDAERLIWIDHHKSSIEKWPTDIPGYRIDGVAACRLAWQWFIINSAPQDEELPSKVKFIEREVVEPLAVRLAGEYDIWDKRDPRAEVFQFGLCSVDLTPNGWEKLLCTDEGCGCLGFLYELVENGTILQRYQQQNNASIVNHRSFMVEFEGLKFLALNTARCNSLTFASKDVPETGHDALCGFYWTGEQWKVSLYHAKHRTDLDLSLIAVKHGGGGHRGACGFQTAIFPFA